MAATSTFAGEGLLQAAPQPDLPSPTSNTNVNLNNLKFHGTPDLNQNYDTQTYDPSRSSENEVDTNSNHDRNVTQTAKEKLENERKISTGKLIANLTQNFSDLQTTVREVQENFANATIPSLSFSQLNIPEFNLSTAPFKITYREAHDKLIIILLCKKS